MADEEQAAATDEKQSPVIQPQSIYIKDVSFETPNSPEIFTAKWEPEVNMLMDGTSKDLGDDVYEVVLSFTLTINVGDQTAYLAEVHQAGIFTLTGLTPEQLH
ncbi:MAG: protein-export chaperone SecB, partial [Gammaproteobacteria bacterium]|nr:protein-export chaperone SecB [Gammaproteobacteria bacterium]